MFAMKPSEKKELDAYRELGTVEEIRARLASPYPINDDYAPKPWSGPEFPDGQFSGLLEDDDFEMLPGDYEPVVNNDWEEK